MTNNKEIKFAIFTHVVHGQLYGDYFAYAPYVNEMNIWAKYVSEIVIVAPINSNQKTEIDSFYIHNNLKFKTIKSFNFTTISSTINAIFSIPKILFTIFKTMQTADHIHLRCPGNIGLLACIVQIFFPKKIKTAKYAGNWDPKATQPLSYKLQKYILSNTYLTKNMQVLVYGEWNNQSENIKSFFTATYSSLEIENFIPKNLNKTIKFLFVGTLSSGKRPLYCIELIGELSKIKPNIVLEIYGDGAEKETLKKYIKDNSLEKTIILKGNQQQGVLKQAYIDSHFVILPSKSEGWPKAIAEGMFWGCLPIATYVSCIANMLDNENRGLILDLDLKADVEKINFLIDNQDLYQQKVTQALQWSRQYTTDFFEQEISKLLTNN